MFDIDSCHDGSAEWTVGMAQICIAGLSAPSSIKCGNGGQGSG